MLGHSQMLSLAEKHGGFMWTFPGGQESLCFFDDEARRAFDAEWRALGGAFEPEPEQEKFDYHEDWSAEFHEDGGGY